MSAAPPQTGAAYLSAARTWSRMTKYLSMRSMSSPASGAALHPYHIIELCIVWSGMRVDSMSLVDLPVITAELSSFCVYNEATGSWDHLPPMPVAVCCASSGVIGDLLLIAGGSSENTLQIFSFTTRQWRVGPTLLRSRISRPGVVSEGKLFIPDQNRMLIYDPQSDAWTEEGLPFSGSWHCACVHYGRIIVFQHNGSAYERDPDGSWSAYRCAHAHARDALKAPAGAAHGSWGTTRVESVLLG